MVSRFAWVVKGSDEGRKSRLHTRRGRLAPLSELIRLPAAIVDRRRQNDLPWMARGAVEWLDRELDRSMSLLELGSGASTAWYAQRTKRVVSIEPNADWAAVVGPKVSPFGNVEIVQADVAEAWPSLRMADFTVVIVDHTDEPGMTRPDVLANLPDSVKIAVLDDSDRARYGSVVMPGWQSERFVSFRSRPLLPTETTIFTRD